MSIYHSLSYIRSHGGGGGGGGGDGWGTKRLGSSHGGMEWEGTPPPIRSAEAQSVQFLKALECP